MGAHQAGSTRAEALRARRAGDAGTATESTRTTVKPVDTVTPSEHQKALARRSAITRTLRKDGDVTAGVQNWGGPTVRHHTRAGATPIRRQNAQPGMTLIEVVVALGLFGISSTFLIALAIVGFRTSSLSTERLAATGLAQSELATFRSGANVVDPVPGSTTRTAKVGNVPFTVVRTVAWISAGTTTKRCGTPTSASNNYAYLSVSAAVTWPRNPVNGIRVATIVYPGPNIAPPAAAGGATANHGVRVTITDADQQPVTGALIKATNSIGTASTGTTDATGCVRIDGLAPGPYTVTASQAGYADPLGSATPSQLMVVTTQPTSFPTWDQTLSPVVSVNVTLAQNSNATPFPAIGIPVKFWGSHNIDGSTQKIKTTTAVAVNAIRDTATNNIVAGTCADSNQPGVLAVAVPTVGPAGSVTVPTAGYLVTAKTGAGVAIANTALAAVHAPDSGCPSGEIYPLGNTNASGVVKVSLPFGSWSFQFVTGTTSVPGAAQTVPSGLTSSTATVTR